jgi:hypothetical protein
MAGVDALHGLTRAQAGQVGQRAGIALVGFGAAPSNGIPFRHLVGVGGHTCVGPVVIV